MSSLSRSLLMLILLMIITSCGRQVHPMSNEKLVIAQVSPRSERLPMVAHKPSEPVAAGPSKKYYAKTLWVKHITKPVLAKVEKVTALKEKTERTFTQHLTAAKQVKKVQEVRLADILFFVVLAGLVILALALLHQVGVSTDMALFIAMGIAVVIIVTYIYLHTWIFTA